MRIAPPGGSAERVFHFGLGMTALAMLTLVLYAIYQTLSGVFVGLPVTYASGPALIVLGTLLTGLTVAVAGYAVNRRQRRPAPSAQRHEQRTTIAA